jgi:glycerophosphoryl diester phosphodiesterase
VLSHDATVDRCTNGKGRMDAMTEQVEALDAGVGKGAQFTGTKIPTFDEVLELARGKIGTYLDIKNATAQDLVTHIDGHGMTDGLVMYCKPNLRIAFGASDFTPEIIAVSKQANAAVYVDRMDTKN